MSPYPSRSMARFLLASRLILIPLLLAQCVYAFINGRWLGLAWTILLLIFAAVSWVVGPLRNGPKPPPSTSSRTP